MAIIMSLWRDK